MEKLELDKVLLAINGWGKFQKVYYFVICWVIIFSVFPMSYIFTARDIKYRCKIESCAEDIWEYNPEWLKHAVPHKDEVPNRCLYYEPLSNSTCTDFNASITRKCHGFIYERNQTTITHDFDIHCDENLWKLTSVGTISVLGEFFSLPFAGFVSDHYGRKTMVVISVFLSTCIGLIRSFSTNYYMFVSLEFLDSMFCSGMYSGAFLLAIEIVDSKHRNMGNTLVCCAFALGQILFAGAAWIAPTWRIMLRILYLPGFAIGILFWFLPESVRWLLSKKRKEEAWKVLNSIAKTNKTLLDPDIYPNLQQIDKASGNETPNTKELPLLTVLRSKVLFLRTIHCAFTWICCNFPYYGLTIQSVALSQDIYLNFMCTSLVEVPAYLFTYGCIDKFGRRKSLAVSLIMAGLSCTVVDLLQGRYWLALSIFLLGKFFITMAYSTLYIYTAEMFPTHSRHSTFAICSMFGRLGSMLAPQVPLLSRIMRSLPLLVFSGMTLSSGVLAFWFPETHNVKLPDETYEAVNIKGVVNKKKSSKKPAKNNDIALEK